MTCDSWTPVQAPSQMGLSNLPKDPETAGSPLTSGKGGLRSPIVQQSLIFSPLLLFLVLLLILLFFLLFLEKPRAIFFDSVLTLLGSFFSDTEGGPDQWEVTLH